MQGSTSLSSGLTRTLDSTRAKAKLKTLVPATHPETQEIPEIEEASDESESYENSGLHGQEKATKKDDSTFQKVKTWFTSIKAKGGKLHASPLMKVAYGSVLASGAWTAANIALKRTVTISIPLS